MDNVNINSYRKMLNIQRLAGTYKQRSYNIAEHSYYVAILFQYFASIEKVEYGVNELSLILRHDLVEVLTGDLIYTVKNSSIDNKERWVSIEEEIVSKHKEFLPYLDSNLKSELSKDQLRLFKICDLLELWIFLQEEKFFGNKNWSVIDISKRCVSIIQDYCLMEGEREFYSVLEFMKNYEPWKE
jgi:5'-deoxynucleotidase YfbR-like HD superfamily hydrolase